MRAHRAHQEGFQKGGDPFLILQDLPLQALPLKVKVKSKMICLGDRQEFITFRKYSN